MPPRERFPPDDPREWLNRARSNLAKAKARIVDVYWEDLCFDAQQAAEKAIKAVLIHHGVEFPYVHDLNRLLALLEARGLAIPDAVRRATRLTRYATITRYPGVPESVSEAQYQEAVASADAVVHWAQGRLQRCP